MKINSINTSFQGGTTSLTKLAQKAERRLQKRLTGYENLMYDMNTDTYYRFSSGKKFTGKYRIGTKDLEQFFHIKNGKLHFTLVKGLDGSKKVGGFGIGRMKLWVGNPSYEERVMIAGLNEMKARTDAEMMQSFGVKKCIENGTSTYIGSRGF